MINVNDTIERFSPGMYIVTGESIGGLRNSSSFIPSGRSSSARWIILSSTWPAKSLCAATRTPFTVLRLFMIISCHLLLWSGWATPLPPRPWSWTPHHPDWWKVSILPGRWLLPRSEQLHPWIPEMFLLPVQVSWWPGPAMPTLEAPSMRLIKRQLGLPLHWNFLPVPGKYHPAWSVGAE